jgi:hypothetical protein
MSMPSGSMHGSTSTTMSRRMSISRACPSDWYGNRWRCAIPKRPWNVRTDNKFPPARSSP